MANIVNAVKVFRPGLILLATLMSGAASAQLPQGTYACEVQTKDGIAGLVMVQADTLAKAQTAATKARASKIAGGESQATSVIECIVVGEGSFRDSHFQQFYENFPK